MSGLLDRLQPNARRGSKPRCHLLTHGCKEEVAERLTRLAAPWVRVNPGDQWMPHGFDDTGEADLTTAHRLLPEPVRRRLRSWWLAVGTPNARTPNWDIASTCVVGSSQGILLVEAKAHQIELDNERVGKRFDRDASNGTRINHEQIGRCIEEATNGLARDIGLRWGLSRDRNYQMSNRFVWAWKLTELGFPVVLIYLGFLNADEMRDQGEPLTSSERWDAIVREHAADLVPAEAWNNELKVNGRSLIPLIRSMEIALPTPGSEARSRE